jgi:hypothetical protein
MSGCSSGVRVFPCGSFEEVVAYSYDGRASGGVMEGVAGIVEFLPGGWSHRE